MILICNNFMNHLYDLQGQLAMNQLPYPKYYNGQTWNTIIDKSSRNMPAYLSEDLPPIKYHYIRHKFKEMSSLGCPRLTFFQSIISKKQQPNARSRSNSNRHFAKDLESQQIQTAKHIRQEMKYALLTGNEGSNVIAELIDKANKIEERIKFKKSKPKKRENSLKIIKDGEGCFENTLAIVTKLRKNKISLQKVDQSNSRQGKVLSIKLLPYLRDEHK